MLTRGAVLFLGLASAAPAAQLPEDETLFTRQCALCHLENVAPKGSPNEKAPTRAQLRQFTAEAVLNALTNGKMQQQGSLLNDPQRRQVAQFASGKLLAATPATQVANRCTDNTRMGDPTKGASWNGHGNGPEATRFAKNGGITAADLPRLKLKWAFGYANVGAARTQPTLAGGRLFVTSENGEVQALNPRTGCSYWTFRADAGVRAAPSVAAYRSAQGARGYAVYFADTKANVYGVDADTGKQIWVRRIEDHPSVSISGAPVVHDGRLFIGTQALARKAAAAPMATSAALSAARCRHWISTTAMCCGRPGPSTSRSRARRARTACRCMARRAARSGPPHPST